MLIGFDDRGRPLRRIEQRVMPAGPSIVDMIANAAFYYGTVLMLMRQPLAPEAQIAFADARENFYRAARYGLDAQLRWLGGQRVSAGELLEQQLLPLARAGLERLNLSTADVARYMQVIAGRLRSRRNGAVWQLAHHARHRDFARLTADYLDHQRHRMPVHEWPI